MIKHQEIRNLLIFTILLSFGSLQIAKPIVSSAFALEALSTLGEATSICYIDSKDQKKIRRTAGFNAFIDLLRFCNTIHTSGITSNVIDSSVRGSGALPAQLLNSLRNLDRYSNARDIAAYNQITKRDLHETKIKQLTLLSIFSFLKLAALYFAKSDKNSLMGPEDYIPLSIYYLGTYLGFSRKSKFYFSEDLEWKFALQAPEMINLAEALKQQETKIALFCNRYTSDKKIQLPTDFSNYKTLEEIEFFNNKDFTEVNLSNSPNLWKIIIENDKIADIKGIELKHYKRISDLNLEPLLDENKKTTHKKLYKLIHDYHKKDPAFKILITIEDLESVISKDEFISLGFCEPEEEDEDFDGSDDDIDDDDFSDEDLDDSSDTNVLVDESSTPESKPGFFANLFNKIFGKKKPQSSNEENDDDEEDEDFYLDDEDLEDEDTEEDCNPDEEDETDDSLANALEKLNEINKNNA